MNFDTFWSDILATLVGGAILTFVFFWLREKIFPLPEVTGHWYFEVRIKDTACEPHRNLILRYAAILWRKGNSIEGTVERIYDNSSTGEKYLPDKYRTRGNVEGYIEKKYFGKDSLFLHVVEDGQGRESTDFYELTTDSGEIMLGKFTSMVINQDGRMKWQRTPF